MAKSKPEKAKSATSKKKISKKKVSKKKVVKKTSPSKTAAGKPVSKKVTTRKQTSASKSKPAKKADQAPVTSLERDEMIAVAAYYRWEQSGFVAELEVEHWLLAEQEIDNLLKQSS